MLDKYISNGYILNIKNSESNKIKLKELRKLNDVTQKNVSSYLNIYQGNYSQIENGKRSLLASQVRPLAKVLNVTETEILNCLEEKWKRKLK